VRRGVPNSSRTGDQLVLDDRLDADARRQDIEIILDLLADLVEFVADFVAAKRRQAGEAQFEDGAGLLFRQVVGVLVDAMARIVDQRGSGFRRRTPASGASSAARARSADRRLADQADDLVDIGDGNGEADQAHGRARAPC
jgi:hypothetical protein